jgi:hypothetical protein
MRKKQTFLLTVLTPEDQDSSFCGKIKVVATGEIRTFTNLEEMNQFIVTEMESEQEENALMDAQRSAGEANIPSQL